MEAPALPGEAGPRWQRYFAPVPALSRGMPVPFLGVMVLIWQLRSQDLQQRYRLHTRAGRMDFLAWCLVSGRQEYAALREAHCWLDALAGPAGPALPDADDPGHAMSWAMCLAARARADLAIDLAGRTGRMALLMWYLSHGRRELGLGLAPWQRAFLEAPGALEGLNRQQTWLWQSRPDVQTAFPLPGARAAYLVWCDDFERASGADAAPCPASPVAPLALPPGVNIIGHAFGQLGIGEDARMAARAFSTTKLAFTLIDFPLPPTQPQNERSMEAFVSSHPSYATNLFCLPALEHARYFAERGSAHLLGRRNIGYWQWELSAWPEGWRHLFSLSDEIWVSSEHTRAAIGAASPVPVHLMPMAVELSRPSARTRASFALPPRDCLFLFVFDLSSSARRKNPQACLDAFLQAFPRTHGVGLVIKVHAPARPHAQWNALKALARTDPRIHLIEESLSKADLLALYQMCDCFISLHRAEGFGRCLAEALLLERPLIATAYSGSLMVANDNTAMMVGYRLAALARDDYPDGEGQVWAEPDVAVAAAWMRRVHQDAGPARLLAGAGRDHVGRTHNAQAVGARYAAALARAAVPALLQQSRVRRGPTAPRLFIGDPALGHAGGHHTPYAQCIGDAARQAGYAVQRLSYPRGWGGPDASCSLILAPGQCVYDTLAALSAADARPDHDVLLPSVSEYELVAWLHWISSTPHLALVPRMHMVLRYPPTGLARERSTDWLRLRARLGGLAGLGSTLALHADTAPLAQRYAALLGLPVGVVPIPFDQRHLGEPGGPGRPVTVLYLGDARPEKGFERLPALVAAVWETHLRPGRMRFVIQANLNVPAGQGAVKQAIAALGAYAAQHVELIHTPLSGQAYYARLQACDIVLLPYQAQAYRERSSGILVEALAAGKAVLTTADTWMASQVAWPQAELVAEAAELAGPLLALVARLPAALAAGRAAAPAWRARAHPDCFVRELFRRDSARPDARASARRPRRAGPAIPAHLAGAAQVLAGVLGLPCEDALPPGAGQLDEASLAAVLPLVLASDACAAMDEGARQHVLQAPAQAARMFLAVARPAALAPGHIVVHGALRSSVVLRLRPLGAARSPVVAAFANGQRLPLQQVAHETGVLCRFDLAEVNPWPWFHALALRFDGPDPGAWQVEAVLLEQGMDAEHMARPPFARTSFHGPEVDGAGRAFAWTALPVATLAMPIWRGADSTLVIDAHALGRHRADQLAVECGAWRGPLSAGTGTALTASIPRCDDAAFNGAWKLHAPCVEQLTTHDPRLLGMALYSATLLTPYFHLARFNCAD